MKSIKFNKTMVLCSLFFVGIIVCGIIGYSTKPENINRLEGRKEAEALANSGDGYVALLDGKEITKKQFDTYKLVVNEGKEKN